MFVHLNINNQVGRVNWGIGGNLRMRSDSVD